MNFLWWRISHQSSADNNREGGCALGLLCLGISAVHAGSCLGGTCHTSDATKISGAQSKRHHSMWTLVRRRRSKKLKESNPFILHIPFLLWIAVTPQAEQKEISKQVEGALAGWTRVAQAGGGGKKVESVLEAPQRVLRVSVVAGSGPLPWAVALQMSILNFLWGAGTSRGLWGGQGSPQPPPLPGLKGGCKSMCSVRN